MATAILTDLQRRGFVLHPLKGKIPLMKKWQELTSSPPDIEKHVEAGGNVGAVCGRASNITVIDLDSFLFASDIFGTEIETLKAQRTEGRGHLYFKYNERLPASKHHNLNIEVLSDGNNIVLPGSIHPSGDLYQWKNPDAPILGMPVEVEANLLRLFKTETELKRILAKCRHCFRDIIKRKPDMHGSDGREMMLVVCADLKANGADEQHIKMFAKLMYREKFDEGRTMQEWRNIDPTKTWTCETLKAKLPAYVDLTECEKCDERRMAFQNRPDLIPTPPKVIDFTATTDLSNAKRFVQLHRQNIRYVPLWKCWVVFDGKRWVEKKEDRQMVPLVEQMIMQMRAEAEELGEEDRKEKRNTDRGQKLLKHAINTESENKIMACIRLAASQPEIQAVPDDFDKDKYLLNFQNGTVELHTGDIQPFRREDMITRICAVPYNPETPYPDWLAFLHLIFEGDESVIEYVQKFVGMAFTGDVSEELFHILHGTAGTGKTTFMNTLNYILGEQYFKNAAVETVLKRGQKSIANDIARLQGARIVWANEPEFKDVLTEAKIKKLTSKERMLGEMKYREPTEFEPEYSLILSANHKPIIRGTDEGLRRRVRLIPFNLKIIEGKDIHFLERLKPQAEGIIKWVLEGSIKWQKEGLNPPEKILEATDEYHQEMDRLAEFFNLYIIKDPQAKTPHILLYTVYKIWAEYSEVMVMSEKAFTQMMIERGFKKITARLEDGRQFRGFAAVKINDTQRLVTLAGGTITTNLITSVTDFLSAPDNERYDIKLRLLQMVRDLSNPFIKRDTRTQGNSVTSVTSVTNDMQSSNSIFSSSVTSVTSVTEIIKLLKEQYDQLNKPDSIQDLAREKINMRNSIILKLNESLPDNQEIPGNEFIDKVVADYCHVRGWQ